MRMLSAEIKPYIAPHSIDYDDIHHHKVAIYAEEYIIYLHSSISRRL